MLCGDVGDIGGVGGAGGLVESAHGDSFAELWGGRVEGVSLSWKVGGRGLIVLGGLIVGEDLLSLWLFFVEFSEDGFFLDDVDMLWSADVLVFIFMHVPEVTLEDVEHGP